MLFVGPTTSAVRARNGAKNAPEPRMRTRRFMPRSSDDIQHTVTHTHVYTLISYYITLLNFILNIFTYLKLFVKVE